MNSIPEIETDVKSGEKRFYIASFIPEDILKIARYLLFINKYNEQNLKGNALDKTEQFCRYIENGGKWYFSEEILKEIREAIEILWPDA